MKTKLSKRILSVVLAALMVVTSVPLMAFTAFADVSTSDLNVSALDSTAKNLYDAMGEFEDKLQEDTVWADVTTAYAKYVAAQKAFDAYVYGTGAASAADTAASELRAATDALTAYTGRMSGNAIPTFPAWDSGKTAEQCMQEYAGTGYKNVLKASTATQVVSAGPAGDVYHYVHYSPDAVLIYDGSGDQLILPVMISAHTAKTSNGKNKSRYIWSAYPSESTSSTQDNADFYLDMRWQSANGSDANWNYNWWGSQWGGISSNAEYNFATGAPGTVTNKTSGYVTSSRIPAAPSNWLGTVTGTGTPLYMSNALKFKGTPAEWGQQYTLSWVVATGGDNNNDSTNTQASAPISVINYKTYADKFSAAYGFVRSLDLKAYSEGGLTNFFNTMKTIAAYDPNTTAASAADAYAAVITAMQANIAEAEAVCEDVTNSAEWDLGYDNSTEYENLRGAMNKLTTTYNNGVNTGYTDESWDGFVALWSQAQAVMTDVVANDYSNPGRANTLATQLSNYKLETNVAKVDTATIELIMDTYASWAAVFTDETAENLNELITEVKTTVWAPGENGEDQYKNAAAALDDKDNNQNLVNNYAFQLVSAIKALRLSPDAIVTTSYGKYSVNSAMAREAEVADHKDDYGNYANFQTALNSAAEYKDSLAALGVDFAVTTTKKGELVVETNYADLLAQYTAVANEVVEKREALAAALIKIANGEIMKTVGTSTISVGSKHGGGDAYNPNVSIDTDNTVTVSMTYPASVILFKTTHDDAKYTFGQANIEYSMKIPDKGVNTNGLDSISINANRVSGNIKQKFWAGGQQGNAYPEAIPSSDLPYVDGALSYTVTNANGGQSTFQLENIKFASQSNSALNTIFAYDDSGNAIGDKDADLTSVLANTKGVSSKSMQSVIPLKASNNGITTRNLSADFTVTVPGEEKQALSAETRPNVQYVNMTGNYFGATYEYTVYKTSVYSGWDHASTVPNGDYEGQEMYSSVMVIDIAYLVDLIKECNALTSQGANFTEESWSAFVEALSTANEAIPYTDSTSSESVRKTVQSRYDDLWAAYQALEIPITFVGKNADGTDKVTSVNVSRGHYLDDGYNAAVLGLTTNYMDQITAATATAATYYSADLSTRYDHSGWSPSIDGTAWMQTPVTAKATYTADYVASPNLADFTAYNQAKADLAAALSTAAPTYSVDTLNSVKAQVEAMTYFAMSEAEKGTVIATAQNAINTEAAAINAITAGLAPAEVSADDAEVYVAAKKSVLDMDIYNVNAVTVDYTETVTIDGIDCDGLIFDTYAKLDKVVADILNTATKNVYEIKLNGNVVGTAEYGEVVVVDSNGKLYKGIDIDTSFDELTNVAWKYSYEAPSRADQGFTTPKYMLTATSLGFVVKGNTNLTTANAKADDAGCTVKFVTNDGRVFDVQYTTTGTVTMPVAPNYAFYTFTGYDNGKSARQEITVTEDTVITANYEATATDMYTIDYFDSVDSWWSQSSADQYVVKYNERVELSNPDAYCWAIGTHHEDEGLDIYTLLAYGDSYTFYACESFEYDVAEGLPLGIVAITADEYEMLVCDATDPDTGELAEDTADYIVDANGNPVLANIDWGGNKELPDPAVSVSIVEDTFAIYNSLGSAEKFSIVGSSAIPDGCKLVESGFLVSTNRTATLTLENSGVNGVNRLKSSKTIGDNQFVANIRTSSNITFKAVAYVIVEMPDGSLNTIYSDIYNCVDPIFD